MFKSAIKSKVAVLIGGTTLGHAIYLAASPVLTRLYTPQDFGTLAIFISGLSIPAVLTSLRYEMAIPLPEDDEDAANLLVLCLIIVLIAALLVTMAVLLLGETITRWTNAPALRPYLWLFAPSLLGLGIYQALSCWAIRRYAFRQITYTRLSQSILQVLIQLGMGLMSIRPLGLLLGESVGRLSGCSTLAGHIWRFDRDALRRISLRGIRRNAARYVRFPMFGGAAALLSAMGLELPMLLIASIHNPKVVGWYALAVRLVSVPLNVLIRAVSQVYFGEFTLLMRTDRARLVPLFFRYTGWVLCFSLPYTVILALSGPRLIPWLFGPRWDESRIYLEYVCISTFIQSIAVPTGTTLDALERQDVHLIREIIRIMLIAGAALVAKSWDLGPRQTVGLFAAAESTTFLLYLTTNLITLKMSGICETSSQGLQTSPRPRTQPTSHTQYIKF